MVMIIKVVMVVTSRSSWPSWSSWSSWSTWSSGKTGQTGQPEHTGHTDLTSDLTFQATCEGQLSQFLRCSSVKKLILRKSLHCWDVLFWQKQNLTICLFRLVWKNMFLQWKNSEGCFASGRSTEDEIIQNFLIDSSLGTSQSKKTGYDFSLHREIVCTFWKHIFSCYSARHGGRN